MRRISEEDVLNISFAKSLNREEMLIKKYNAYYKQSNNKEIKKILVELNKTSKEHIKLIQEIMVKLNIHIS